MQHRFTKVVCSILVILFGIFLFIYGGWDDSPGAQLLGFVVAALGTIGAVKSNKKSL
jgi:hypothetical protein